MRDEEELFVICHDSQTLIAVSSLNHSRVTPILLSDMENCYPELEGARKDRSELEYFFLLSPYVIEYAFEKSNCDIAIYVDADLYFFRKPSEALHHMSQDFHVSIIPHRFSPRDLYMEKYGRFNVGWVAFRNSERGREVLEYWRTACLKSTSTTPTESVFGDQKYLDNFEAFEGSTQVVEHPGMNVAPWNFQYVNSLQDGLVHDKSELLFFHFSGFKKFRFISSIGFAGYSKFPSFAARKHIYRRYLDDLNEFESKYNCSSAKSFKSLSLKLWLRELYYRDLMLNINPRKYFQNLINLLIRKIRATGNRQNLIT